MSESERSLWTIISNSDGILHIIDGTLALNTSANNGLKNMPLDALSNCTLRQTFFQEIGTCVDRLVYHLKGIKVVFEAYYNYEQIKQLESYEM